jgi:hypothetical protein
VRVMAVMELGAGVVDFFTGGGGADDCDDDDEEDDDCPTCGPARARL